jgi:hypothetical protein
MVQDTNLLCPQRSAIGELTRVSKAPAMRNVETSFPAERISLQVVDIVKGM